MGRRWREGGRTARTNEQRLSAGKRKGRAAAGGLQEQEQHRQSARGVNGGRSRRRPEHSHPLLPLLSLPCGASMARSDRVCDLWTGANIDCLSALPLLPSPLLLLLALSAKSLIRDGNAGSPAEAEASAGNEGARRGAQAALEQL